jgi:hypothetical protein
LECANLVSIEKREGGRRPPWIGCKLCLDLNGIFLVCILSCVDTKSEIFLLVVITSDLGSELFALAAGPIFISGAKSIWRVHELVFHSSLRPGPCSVLFSAEALGFALPWLCCLFPKRAATAVFLLRALELDSLGFARRRAAPRQSYCAAAVSLFPFRWFRVLP